MPDRIIPSRNGNGRSAPVVSSARDISSRGPISREGGRVIETVRNITDRSGITRETYRGVIFPGFGSSASQAELLEISRRINENLFRPSPRPTTNIQANDATGNALLPIYGTGSPFDILGDAFLRAFGGSVYQPPRQSERTVIESIGGGSNIGILVILGAIAFGVYYFFIRK